MLIVSVCGCACVCLFLAHSEIEKFPQMSARQSRVSTVQNPSPAAPDSADLFQGAGGQLLMFIASKCDQSVVAQIEGGMTEGIQRGRSDRCGKDRVRHEAFERVKLLMRKKNPLSVFLEMTVTWFKKKKQRSYRSSCSTCWVCCLIKKHNTQL